MLFNFFREHLLPEAGNAFLRFSWGGWHDYFASHAVSARIVTITYPAL